MKTYWLIGKEGFKFRIEKEVCVFVPRKKRVATAAAAAPAPSPTPAASTADLTAGTQPNNGLTDSAIKQSQNGSVFHG